MLLVTAGDDVCFCNHLNRKLREPNSNIIDPKEYRQRVQWKRMSMDLVRLVLLVLFVNPSVVKFSVCRADLGWGQPILMII